MSILHSEIFLVFLWKQSLHGFVRLVNVPDIIGGAGNHMDWVVIGVNQAVIILQHIGISVVFSDLIKSAKHSLFLFSFTKVDLFLIGEAIWDVMILIAISLDIL